VKVGEWLRADPGVEVWPALYNSQQLSFFLGTEFHPRRPERAELEPAKTRKIREK
jgi:hypothetical protein